MGGDRLTFHVPQEAGPKSLIPLLEAMNAEQMAFDSASALLDFADEHDLGSRQEMPIFATECGLLERSEKGIRLSDTAAAILALRPEVRSDVIHFLLCTGWNEDNPLVRTVLWSYRQVVSLLWEQRSVHLSGAATVLAEEVRNQIQDVFSTDPSFSTKSIRGVRKWLEALVPSVVSDDHFSRRQFCAPELALLALGWVGQMSGGETNIDLLLTTERRDAVCKICLLDPVALDRVVDWTLPLYPAILRSGTSAGAYGRFIRFIRWPSVGDLAGFK